MLDASEKQRVIVGFNDYINENEDEIEVLKITQEMEESQKQRLSDVKRSRDSRAVTSALKDLEVAARLAVTPSQRSVLRRGAQRRA